MTTLDRAMVRTWLDVLYVAAPGLIHVCATDNWVGRAFTDRDAAVDYIAGQDEAGREGIYLRVSTLAAPLAAHARGGEADTLALPGLWADIDIAGPGHKTDQQLPPDVAAAQQIIAVSGLPAPSMWVHSGGGLYPWWLLDTPVLVDDPTALADLKALSQRWQTVIGRAAAALGFHYGAGVGDLARVLRVPGTVNRKAGLERPCTVLSATADRHTIGDLRAGLARGLEVHPDPAPPAARGLYVVRPAGELPPGDDFEQRTEWGDQLLLGGAGWTVAHLRGTEVQWRRPGKTTAGISATTGRAADRDRLFVFSSDALPFEPWVPYTKFGAYTQLHHGGDHSAAAKELRRLGYGTPPASGYAEQQAAINDLLPTGQYRLVGQVDGTAARQLVDPVPDPATAQPPATYGPTEDGLALALVAHYGNELRFCPQRDTWLRWDGHRWGWDEDERHREHIRDLARSLPSGEDSGFRTFRKRALSAAGVTGIARLAQTDRRVTVAFNRLDSEPWSLNTPQGVIDLRTGKMGPPNPDQLHTRSTLCAADPGADQTVWRRFLADTFGENQELIAYLQRLVGYSAVGYVGPHVLPFCHGSGGNGKGVFLEAVAGVLGDYATTAPVGFLMAQAHASHETEIARLAGARMVICSEVNEDDSFDEAKVKQLTGGDTLTARFMRQDHFSFTPTHHLWLMGNHKPAVRSGGHSFWRRLRLIPFLHEVPEDQVVEDLQGMLIREHGPAILAWIAQGAADFHAGGLREPEMVKAATKAYAKDQDTVAQFVEERCHVGGGSHVQLKAATVREAYEQWCHAQGERPVSAKALSMALHNRFSVDLNKGGKGVRYYAGIALLASDGDDEPGESDSGWSK